MRHIKQDTLRLVTSQLVGTTASAQDTSQLAGGTAKEQDQRPVLRLLALQPACVLRLYLPAQVLSVL